jgi:hypothetical protein
MMRQTLEVEADMMTNKEEEGPHHADRVPGAADDQPAPCDQHLSQDEELHQAALGPGMPTVLQDHQRSQDELHHAAPGPGEDDQPVPQDQQPSNITCNITQPATRPAAVVRLVLNPVGYNVNVPPSHLTTQVQPSHSPRPEQKNLHRMLTTPESPHLEDEMPKTHLEDRKSYVHKNTCQEVVKDKTHIEDVHGPDNKDQQTLHMLTMPNSTHQEAGENETYCEDGNNAMNVEGETTHKISNTHKITFKKAVQKTAPLDAIFPTM